MSHYALRGSAGLPHAVKVMCILSVITWLTLEVWGSCKTTVSTVPTGAPHQFLQFQDRLV